MDQLAQDLSGRRILVVEDDYNLARDLCNDLRQSGATILGPAPTTYYAYNLLLGRRGIDGAVLDIRLHGSEVYDLARHLRERGVPMVFATAYGQSSIDRAFRDTPCLQKPIPPGALVKTVAQMMERLTQFTPQPQPIEPEPVLDLTVLHAAEPVTGSLPDRWSRALVRAMRAA